MIGLALHPVALIAHLLGFRRVNIGTQHIGHLASEPDCLLKLIRLQILPQRRYFITASSHLVANLCLLNYWTNYIPVIKNPILGRLLSAASMYGLMKFDVTPFVTTEKKSAQYYQVNSLWAKRPPLLALSQEHRTKGYDTLRKAGVPDGAWYVCLHVREGGFAPQAESLHSYRNADINNYRLAIDTITSRGGWVIRMGDPTMKILPKISHCIDYAHSKAKSDWMDVFLCAECKFFLGNTSGLFLVSTAFGVPCVLTNVIPFSAQAFTHQDIYIPKLIRNKKTGRYLKFSEILQSPIANFRISRSYLQADVELEENSPEDINELIREALLKLEGQWAPPERNRERQIRFKQLFRQDHYGYHSVSHIGCSFIEKHEDLM